MSRSNPLQPGQSSLLVPAPFEDNLTIKVTASWSDLPPQVDLLPPHLDSSPNNEFGPDLAILFSLDLTLTIFLPFEPIIILPFDLNSAKYQFFRLPASTMSDQLAIGPAPRLLTLTAEIRVSVYRYVFHGSRVEKTKVNEWDFRQKSSSGPPQLQPCATLRLAISSVLSNIRCFEWTRQLFAFIRSGQAPWQSIIACQLYSTHERLPTFFTCAADYASRKDPGRFPALETLICLHSLHVSVKLEGLQGENGGFNVWWVRIQGACRDLPVRRRLCTSPQARPVHSETACM